MKKFLCLIAMCVFGCSSAPAPHGSATVVPEVDSGHAAVDTGSPVNVDSGSPDDASQDAGHVVAVDSGHDAGTVAAVVDAAKVVEDAAKVSEDTGSKVPCLLPSGTYTYTFTSAIQTCDSPIMPYTLGPVSPGALNLSGMLPSFCNGGATSSTGITESTNMCQAAGTFTCTDANTPVKDGGSDPLTFVTVSNVVSDTSGKNLSGTVSLTTTDQVTKVSCTQNYTFTAVSK